MRRSGARRVRLGRRRPGGATDGTGSEGTSTGTTAARTVGSSEGSADGGPEGEPEGARETLKAGELSTAMILGMSGTMETAGTGESLTG